MFDKNVSEFIKLLATAPVSSFNTSKYRITHEPTGVSLWIANGFLFLNLQKGEAEQSCSVFDKLRLFFAYKSFMRGVVWSAFESVARNDQ